jgi:hypothetical protein
MMVRKPLRLIEANDDDPWIENKKKFNFWGKLNFFVMMSPNVVMTSTFYLIWKALIMGFHTRYYTNWFH